MQDQNHVQSTEQSIPTTTPFSNFLYSHANNFNADSNQGQLGVMTPYSMYSMNQWPHTEGLSVSSTSNTGSQSAITSSNAMTTSMTSSGANNIPIMSVSQAAPISPNNVRSNSNAVLNNIPPFMSAPVTSSFGMGQFPIPGMEHNMITLSKCVLYAPYLPVTQNRSPKPFECKTIFVGGLPEHATEEIVEEVFRRFGPIACIKMQLKACRIKFLLQSTVESAFLLNGWEMKIENRDDTPNKGKLFIDYALNFEVLSDSDQETTSEDFLACSEQEISHLAEKLDDEIEFEDAVRVLISWLDRAECNKRNASSFYCLIQKTNNHVQKLMNEKAKFEEELDKAKRMLHDKMSGITAQLKEFEKVLTAAKLQKVWDHFSKAQRKNLELWHKEINEIKTTCSNNLLNERIEDEMEMSDDENNMPITNGVEPSDVMGLSENIDDLQNQLQTVEQESRILKKEKEEEAKSAREKLQTSTQELNTTEEEITKFKVLIENAENETLENGSPTKGPSPVSDLVSKTSESASNSVEVSECEARQVCLIATFLNAHPSGASLDYIYSYLSTVDSDTDTPNVNINARDVEYLMKQLPSIFVEESSGVGSTLRKKWKCNALIKY